MNEIVAVVQTRMTSTRLPGKVLKLIINRPMLWHILQRVENSKLIDNIIIATTLNKKDDGIVEFAQNHGYSFFRGKENDVLDRYYQVSKKYNLRNIVRITSDDPFKDPEIIDKIISEYCQNDFDYVSNTIIPTYPLGLDVEVFSFKALERAWRESNKNYEREHVTPYIWNNPNKFRLLNIEKEGRNLSHLRWTVDTQLDLDFVRIIYQKLFKKNKIFLMTDILNVIKMNPVIQINNNIEMKKIE